MATAEEREARMKLLTDIDEMVVDEDESDPIQYDSVDFILQNLRIAYEDIFYDESQTLAARRSSATTAVLQICFYLGCILKPFSIRRRKPIIAVFGGEGFIGAQVVQKLIDYGLAQFLMIYSRNMLNEAHWTQIGVRVVSSFAQLTDADGKIDVVICCADISAFPHIAHVLIPVINKATAFITSTLGLQRRRVFNLLKTSCVLRTYIEHADAIKRSFNDLDTKSFLKATQHVKQALTLNIPIESDFVGSGLSPAAYAADLIARRHSDIRHLIFIIENNYVVKGLTPSKARNFAIRMVLGSSLLHELEPASLSPNIKQKSDSMLQIEYTLEGMQTLVMGEFQEQLSKYIRVVDLPDLVELAVRVDAPIPVSENLLAHIEMQQEGDSIQDSADLPNSMFESESNDGSSMGSIESDEQLDSPRHDANASPALAPAARLANARLEAKQKEKEEAKKGMESLHAEIHKRKMFLEAQKKIMYDDMYNLEHAPMHADQLICTIFDQDAHSEIAKMALPAKVQSLIALIEEEEAEDVHNEAEDVINAFEGFLQLPSMTSMALSVADLRNTGQNFVSTMPTEDEKDVALSSMMSSKLPSSSKIRHDQLKTTPGAHPVLVEPFSRKGYVSVQRERVNDVLDEFELTGGITVVHEGLPPDPNEENEEERPSTSGGSPTPPGTSIDSSSKADAAISPTKRATPKPPMSRSTSKKSGSFRGDPNGTGGSGGDQKSSKLPSTPGGASSRGSKRQSMNTKTK